MKIGVFDSGLGGLTILRAILKNSPQYDYIYLGDNARVPYGGRSPEIIYQFTQEAVDFLFRQNCQIVILACNSATANALKRIQQEYLPKHYPRRKVLGVIKPTIEYLIEHQAKKAAIIGTYATVESGAYLREIKKVVPSTKVWQQACPLFVPVIEENAARGGLLSSLLKKYLGPLKKKSPQVLFLACTHYGLVKKPIQKYLGKKIKVIGQGQLVAEKLSGYLEAHLELSSKLSKNNEVIYYVTDLNRHFQKIAERFMGKKLNIRKISLS